MRKESHRKSKEQTNDINPKTSNDARNLFIYVKKDGEVFRYSTDQYGYSDLIKDNSVNPDLIQDFDHVKMSNDDKTKIKLLFALKSTNCGCCNAPFLTDGTFKEILEITKNYHKNN